MWSIRQSISHVLLLEIFYDVEERLLRTSAATLYTAVPRQKDPNDIAPLHIFQLYTTYIQSMSLNDTPNEP